ncbi:aldehyde dehydrogenase family protein [Pseudodesulfovibrio sp. zrk46]|uniref:aldehyde dehydrogenase family protein n=1 Tax=Pseudodesulfovibrio sp. zrk46 TaxID=2725288 RepID=UPI00144969C5|nr:aldehyde dehydrogenase family protein [Pseudodesulfovibrio sp. zrk46]QJB57076.1 aldehyde dehydrogenase family protein [Pseudodesulfovibrio sp. zrk46]
MIIDNDLLSIQQARILAENAFEAQKKLAAFPQEKLDAIVEHVAQAVEQHAQSLALMSQEETDSGIWQDKFAKNTFVCKHVCEHLRGMQCVGVIGEDKENELMDIGVPVGVIVAASPVTSPVSTTIYKTLIAIKSGNAIVFTPHPRVMKSISHVLDIMIEAAHAAGLPEGCLAYLDTVTKAGSQELMNHPSVSLIMVSGVPGMLRLAQCSGKAIIYGGTGNGPAFIERTADLNQAVKDIITSKTFDNGMAPSAEQSIVVESCIADDVAHILEGHGAYFMSEEESLKLADLFFCPAGQRKKGTVGVPAATLARRAGFHVPEDVKVLIARRKYVSETDPYSRELLSPVLAFYEEDDWMHACEKCIELLLHERNSHTLSIHSGDKEVIRQFALKKPVGRLLVNTPASFGGMGATTNLFPSMTLGSGSAGRGITSDNVSPKNLIYVRKVGYGVRTVEDAQCAKTTVEHSGHPDKTNTQTNDSKALHALQHILKEAINVINDPSDR